MKCKQCGSEFHGNYCPRCGTKARRGHCYRRSKRIEKNGALITSLVVLAFVLFITAVFLGLALRSRLSQGAALAQGHFSTPSSTSDQMVSSEFNPIPSPALGLEQYINCPIQEVYELETEYGQNYLMTCNIPQFSFDTADAIALNQEIMSIGLEVQEWQKQLKTPAYESDFISADYDAWVSNNLIVIELTVQYYEGGDMYLYILDVQTGQQITNIEMADRLNIDGDISDHIQYTMRMHIEDREAGTSQEQLETQLAQTLRADNLRKSIVFPDRDGTPMLWCYIYQGYYENSFDLIIIPLL